MSEEKSICAVKSTNAYQEIGDLIRQVAKGMDIYDGVMTQDKVIQLLKVCLYELENDAKINAALTIDVGLAADLIGEVACCDFGVMIKHLTPHQACDRIFKRHNEFMRAINESRAD